MIMNTIINESIKNIDSEFIHDMRILAKVATTNHPLVKNCIARYVEIYIQKKVDMELTKSIYKIFK